MNIKYLLVLTIYSSSLLAMYNDIFPEDESNQLEYKPLKQYNDLSPEILGIFAQQLPPPTPYNNEIMDVQVINERFFKIKETFTRVISSYMKILFCNLNNNDEKGEQPR